MVGERRLQLLEVSHPQRHGPATRDAARRVGEADQPVAAPVLEQLDDRGEALVTRTLGNLDLGDNRCPAPGCHAPCSHVIEASAERVTQGERVGSESGTVFPHPAEHPARDARAAITR